MTPAVKRAEYFFLAKLAVNIEFGEFTGDLHHFCCAICINIDTIAVFEHCWNKELCVLDCFPRELLPSCLAYFGKVKP